MTAKLQSNRVLFSSTERYTFIPVRSQSGYIANVQFSRFYSIIINSLLYRNQPCFLSNPPVHPRRKTSARPIFCPVASTTTAPQMPRRGIGIPQSEQVRLIIYTPEMIKKEYLASHMRALFYLMAPKKRKIVN